MKKLILALGLMSSGLQGQVCSIKTLPTYCGSAVVKLVVVESSYYLQQGDIGCWGSDIHMSGALEEVASSDQRTKRYFLEKTDIELTKSLISDVVQLNFGKFNETSGAKVLNQNYFLQCRDLEGGEIVEVEHEGEVPRSFRLEPFKELREEFRKKVRQVCRDRGVPRLVGKISEKSFATSASMGLRISATYHCQQNN